MLDIWGIKTNSKNNNICMKKIAIIIILFSRKYSKLISLNFNLMKYISIIN